MTVPLQPWHLCPAWIKSPLPAECWRTLKSPSMNSAGVDPRRHSHVIRRVFGMLIKDVMLHNHAHPSNACTVGYLTCSTCWHVVHYPYSPDLFHHVMSMCVCGLQVSEALEPGCMKKLRPPWCSDFSSSRSSSSIAWCGNGILASRPMKAISGLASLHRTIPKWVSFEQVCYVMAVRYWHPLMGKQNYPVLL